MPHPNQRIIFGLKVKQLRQLQGLSFADLSASSGISISYLNEIEKGKKYPKADRIESLAKALGSNASELTSPILRDGLAPVGELLESNFLSELPLDLFGIEKAKVVEIIANAPKRVGAFISTLVDLARNYQLGEENFYFGTLRSYLEMHNNYFEDLEEEVAAFAANHNLHATRLIRSDQLASILINDFGYRIEDSGLDIYPELHGLRAIFLPEEGRLLMNSRLTEMQRCFQLGKELGFQYLNLKERANTSSLLRVRSFEEVLSHFKAGYFSAALQLPRDHFVADLQKIFTSPTWDESLFLQLLSDYSATPETIIQRMTNLLPVHFGLRKIFLIRMVHNIREDHFRIDKELHLDGRHNPHENGLYEHYCRRWSSIQELNRLNGDAGKILVGVQRSHYHGTDNAYLCLTIARHSNPDAAKNVSMTIGLKVDENLRQQVAFWDDPGIPDQVVNNTCERCAVESCAERVKPPVIVEEREKRKQVQKRLADLLGYEESQAEK